MGVSGGGVVNPRAFQRAMVFIDGTNLFYRLRAAKIKVANIANIFARMPHLVGSREVVRVNLYTSDYHAKEAISYHGGTLLDGARVIYGDAIYNQKSPTPKEKAVDALLVADLVYHAASRNCDVAALVSCDTDFVYAIRRVEDFGCRSAVLGVCEEVPDRMRQSCDWYFKVEAKALIEHKLAEPET